MLLMRVKLWACVYLCGVGGIFGGWEPGAECVSQMLLFYSSVKLNDCEKYQICLRCISLNSCSSELCNF